ncbi:hypothetical protein U1Q18_029391 [Sarracenia purpurea var. burkii]
MAKKSNHATTSSNSSNKKKNKKKNRSVPNSRKKTLLKEYEQSGKSSVFVDKRIGEQNEALGEFDKAILRSQRERQVRLLNKSSKYNLSDGEEEGEFEIQDVSSLAERDDFEDEVPFDDEDGAEAADTEMNSSILKQLNANDTRTALKSGLIKGEGNRQKTKREVMEEIISKSKFFKAQKAKDKEENEELIGELDRNFTSLVQSEALLSLTQPNKMNALKALVNKSISNEFVKKDVVFPTLNEETLQQDKPDSYDKLVKEMALDMRARPSERTKMPEEIAQEEKERLERLEEERQKRMLATDDSSDEDGNASEDADNAQRLRSISGDDLGDSFSHGEEKKTKRGWIEEIMERENANGGGSEDGISSDDSGSSEDDGDEEGTDEDNDEYEMTQSLKDWEQSDDDELGTDLEKEGDRKEEEVGDEEMEPKCYNKGTQIKDGRIDSLDANKTKENDKFSSTQIGELPYVILAPKSLEELYTLLDNRSDSQIIEAIRRIRACNAISIAAENRKKMQVRSFTLI